MINQSLRLSSAALLLLLCGAAAAQNPCGYAFSVSGQKLFEDHCAGCHGLDGKGQGPFAAAQKRQPADLTAIAKSNNGYFPAAEVAEIIRGGGAIPGHEQDRIMPLWGKVFNGECGPAFSRRAVIELKRYLEGIQR